MNTNVYIDGFNLYYGCLRRTPYRWLDLGKFCELMLPQNKINRIRYFTARVEARPNDPDKPTRQATYLRALETIPDLSVHEGQFLSHQVLATLVTPLPTGARTVTVWKTEEKGSDVNLASYLLMDAFQRDYEVAVVVSNDSDLATPIGMVRNILGLRVGVLNPYRKPSAELFNLATFYKPIRAGALRASQFPAEIRDRHGLIRKPASW